MHVFIPLKLEVKIPYYKDRQLIVGTKINTVQLDLTQSVDTDHLSFSGH